METNQHGGKEGAGAEANPGPEGLGFGGAPCSASLLARIRELEAEVKRLKGVARCKRTPKPGVGGVIMTLRQAQGISLDKLSKESGISKGNLSRMETAEYPNPRLATLETIARTLGHKVSVIVAMAEDSFLQNNQITNPSPK